MMRNCHMSGHGTLQASVHVEMVCAQSQTCVYKPCPPIKLSGPCPLQLVYHFSIYIIIYDVPVPYNTVWVWYGYDFSRLHTVRGMPKCHVKTPQGYGKGVGMKMQHHTHTPAYPWPEIHGVTHTPVIP